jgi:hypothetical protein
MKEKLNKKDSVYKRVLTRVNAILEEHYVNPNNINRKQELETIDNLFPNKLNEKNKKQEVVGCVVLTHLFCYSFTPLKFPKVTITDLAQVPSPRGRVRVGADF